MAKNRLPLKGIQLALRDQVTSAAIEMCREAEGPCIVQHYISRPHTLNGLKYDLRLYIVVTSVLKRHKK